MQNGIRGADVIDPARLLPGEKESLIDSLYQLHSRIFDGVDRNTFVSYVVDSPAEWTRIRIYKNSVNEWVGYCAVHRFKVRIVDHPYVIIRAEAGILREYRGRSQTLWFGFSEAIKYRLKHPLCALYYLGAFVHPAVFYMFSRYFTECYPRADKPVPERVKRFMLELADVFRLEAVEGQDDFVRKVGWITRESAEDKTFWRNHAHPSVKLYTGINPGYGKGYGLLTLVPLTFGNIFMSLSRFAKNKFTRRRAGMRRSR